MVHRGDPLPAIGAHTFTTADDYQTQIDFPIFEGERRVSAGNQQIGQFVIKDLPEQLRGVHKINVKVEVDANGAY